MLPAMAKKIVLDSRSEPAFFTFIGISCHMLDYRLLFEFNRKLDVNFTREADFGGLTASPGNPSSFSFYVYKDEDQRLSYYLLSNRNQEGVLFPSLKQTDFIVVIEGVMKKQKKVLINLLRLQKIKLIVCKKRMQKFYIILQTIL